jgi:phosphoglycolate phosphatase
MQTFHTHYRAIVFDLDGTLLDTLADIGDAANAVLQQLGFPAHALDNYRQFVGEGIAVLFQRAVPVDQIDGETISRCVNAFQIAYRRNWLVRTRPYEGILDLLDELPGRGLRMAVLSNKPHEFTQACVGHYFPKAPFDVVFGQREGIARKPDPAGALEIAQRLAIPAGEFVYLGDSAIDIQTATHAGMHPVGAAWGFRSVEELRAAGAMAVICRPLELLEFLDGREAGESSPGDRGA